MAESGIEPRYADRAWEEYTQGEIFPRDAEASEAGVQALIETSALIRDLPTRARTPRRGLHRPQLARRGAGFAVSVIDYGDRARIGFLVPSGNQVCEPELHAMMPPGVAALVTRLELRGSSEPELLRMVEDLEPAARLLADARPALLAFHCTAVSTFAPAMAERHPAPHDGGDGPAGDRDGRRDPGRLRRARRATRAAGHALYRRGA